MVEPSRTLTVAELSIELGVSEKQVWRWTQKGLPKTKEPRERGLPRHLFNAEEVQAWLIGQGLAPKLVDPLSADEEDGEEEHHGAPLSPDSPVESLGSLESLDYEGMLARLRLAERSGFARWAQAVKQKAGAVMIAALAKQWLDLTDHRRRVEKDVAGIRKQQEEWLLRGDVEEEFWRVGADIKTLFLALPRAMAPRVIGVPVGEAEALLEEQVHAILQSLAFPENL